MSAVARRVRRRSLRPSGTSCSAHFTWINDKFLLDTELRPWTEVPLWIPEEYADNRFFLAVNCEKARAAGLRFRPLAETIRDTLEWDHSRPASMPRRAGLSREREMEVLEGWRSNTEPVKN